MEKVIIRSESAGVFYGELVNKEICGDRLIVEMANCRRIYYWSGAATLSQLAVEGTKSPEDCKFTMMVESITIAGVIEIIPCSEDAINSIEGVKVWKV